jgi:hypothetical protein
LKITFRRVCFEGIGDFLTARPLCTGGEDLRRAWRGRHDADVARDLARNGEVIRRDGAIRLTPK